MRNIVLIVLVSLVSAPIFVEELHADEQVHSIETDLLVAGATESGWAAAIQAARLGIESITIIHDGQWFGGQFTEQALACVDENKGMDTEGWGVPWHPMRRAFHRSGLFKELMDRIEAFNKVRYGSSMPGKPWHGPSTFRPREAEQIFRQMIQPWIDSGRIRVMWNHYPVSTQVMGNRLNKVSFARVGSETATLDVTAQLTIDATDWGEVIQLSGADFECGPDPYSRFSEPSAPREGSFPPIEMNPITWAMIVEQSDIATPVARPSTFDDRNYPRATGFSQREFGDLEWDIPNPGSGSIPHWPKRGDASRRQLSVYSVRRIVDGYSSHDGRTSILLNYMNGQDYPLERLPQRVVDELESIEPGSSEKNIVRMSRPQREVIFADARQHSLGVLYHLQNFVHNAATDRTNSFRNFRLSDEFGTPDRLPPKPYIREGLRLSAMYMMREQDGRNRDGLTKDRAIPRFSNVRYPDGLFAWQFHYDFHRTGRTYLLSEGAAGPWIDYHKKNRHTKFISDRCTFPLRSMVPVSLDGLLGAQGNLGFSSIVSAALRLHDQRVHIGQAAGATAAVCLRQGILPRDIPYNRQYLEAVRHALCGEIDGTVPLLLVGYRDLPADHPAFIAVNRLAAAGIIPITDTRLVDFEPDKEAADDWKNAVIEQVLAQGGALSDLDIQTIVDGDTNRGDFCCVLWKIVHDTRWHEFPVQNRQSNDVDGDGIPDRDDALLFTPNQPIRFEVSVPQLTPVTDGIPAVPDNEDKVRFFDFTGDKGPGDHGAVFDGQSGFGWDADLSRNHRRRNAMSGPRDTFVFTREVNVWEYRVPDGDYRVCVCVGDSGHPQQRQKIEVEGDLLFDEINTREAEFAEGTIDVTITDGRLTIRAGSGRDGSNTCINWLWVQSL